MWQLFWGSFPPKAGVKWVVESFGDLELARIFLISGSIGGKLALLLAYDALGAKDTLIDLGASLDGLAGLESRDFNRRQQLSWSNAPFSDHFE